MSRRARQPIRAGVHARRVKRGGGRKNDKRINKGGTERDRGRESCTWSLRQWENNSETDAH